MQLILLVISILSPLVALIVGNKEKKSLLWCFAATGLFFDLLINFTKRVLHYNSYWEGNLYVLIEFVLISFIYKPIIFKKANLFYPTVIGLAASFIIGTLYSGFWKFNTTGVSIFYFTYIIYGILGMYRLLFEQKYLFLGKERMFWVNCAFLIFGSCNFLLFLFTDYLMTTNSSLFKILWTSFFLMVNTTLNILLAIALSKKKLPDNEFK